MSLARYLPLEFRRKQLHRRAPAGPLRDYLAVPFPDPGQNYDKVTYLAMDLETTGLDTNQDHILSVGSVEIKGDHVNLSTACHCIVNTELSLSEESVIIHKLTDDLVAKGESITQVLTDVLQHLAGKVLVAHHARIEYGFLRTACQRVFGGDLLVPIVDTFALAQRQMARRDEVITSGALRLGALRERYHLPRYKAHNALTDAIAAAELFLAQAAERCGNKCELPLKRLLVKM